MTPAAYEEIIELGTGARGRVALVRDRASGAPAVARWLTARSGEIREEAGLLARLDDPRLVRVLAVRDATASGGPGAAPQTGAVLLLEPVEGVDLRRLLAEYRVLAPEAALRVLRDSLLALAAAGRAGVLHRDYRPAAVVVKPDGTSKLAGFGVTRPGPSKPGPDGVRADDGKPDYPAPEQRSGARPSSATDLYAATAVFAECLTGDGGDRPVPECLLPLIRRGTAADPADRPSDPLEFAAELEEAALAAYGPDWELLGSVALAGAVAGLPPAFTLTQLPHPSPDPVPAPTPVPASTPNAGAYAKLTAIFSHAPTPDAGVRAKLAAVFSGAAAGVRAKVAAVFSGAAAEVCGSGRSLLSQMGGVKTVAAILAGIVVGLAGAVVGTRAFLAEDRRPAVVSPSPAGLKVEGTPWDGHKGLTLPAVDSWAKCNATDISFILHQQASPA